MARNEPGDFPVDTGGKEGYDGPASMGLNFDTSGQINEPAYRSTNYPVGKFAGDGVKPTVISVEDIYGDPMGVFGGSPDDGFAGGPGGKVVHTKNAEAGPA